MSMQTTGKLEMAAQFVNSTASHIYLTGKAGTGKTTFLHNLAQATHKNHVVVAPTGIAALNAKGVTIHSQFLLPFGSYLPQETRFEAAPQANFYTRRQLASRHSLNSARKQVLRNIDLLIIDEVSMLRADLLDAIDYRLKSVKGNYKKSFGGVQLLMIGDLYQLPPIVKDQEWEHLQRFYKSPHFFESRALQEDGFTYIELDKIFRQQDDGFIRILNNLRDNRWTQQDLDILNSHYQENEVKEEGVITLTTHNYRADRLNREELDKLPGKSHYYEAEIHKDFPEHLFPLPESMELREGAQVMFIKNDVEGNRYFNGKLAKVTQLTQDGICVSMEGDENFWLEPHEWENVKYQVNEKTKELEGETVGTFTQFPIRLAWAITVHKSQGLTFDKAVIDVGRAFAPGQVYVALSRLRKLSGLRLRTKIPDSVISSDAEVVKFSEAHQKDDALPGKLKQEQSRYLRELLFETFDFATVVQQIEYTQQKAAGKMEFEDAEMQMALGKIKDAFLGERENTTKFRIQLDTLLTRSDMEKLQQRLKKGSKYYLGFLYKQSKELLIHLEEVKQVTRTKTYRNALEEIDQVISVQIMQVHKVCSLSECMIEGREVKRQPELREERQRQRKELLKEVAVHIRRNPKNLSTKSGRKRKKAKGETYQQTYSMLKEGLNPEAIAEKRGLAIGTIESHLAKGIEAGEIDIDTFIADAEFEVMEKAFQGNTQQNITEVFKGLDGKYSYGRLRMVQAHLRRK